MVSSIAYTWLTPSYDKSDSWFEILLSVYCLLHTREPLMFKILLLYAARKNLTDNNASFSIISILRFVFQVFRKSLVPLNYHTTIILFKKKSTVSRYKQSKQLESRFFTKTIIAKFQFPTINRPMDFLQRIDIFFFFFLIGL